MTACVYSVAGCARRSRYYVLYARASIVVRFFTVLRIFHRGSIEYFYFLCYNIIMASEQLQIARTELDVGADSAELQLLELSVLSLETALRTRRAPDFYAVSANDIKLAEPVPRLLRGKVGEGYDYMSTALRTQSEFDSSEVLTFRTLLSGSQLLDNTKIESISPSPHWMAANTAMFDVRMRGKQDPRSQIDFADYAHLIGSMLGNDDICALADPRQEKSFSEAALALTDLLRPVAKSVVTRVSYTDNEPRMAMIGNEPYLGETGSKLEVETKNRRRTHKLTLVSPYETSYGRVIKHFEYELERNRGNRRHGPGKISIVGDRSMPEGVLKQFAHEAAREYTGAELAHRAIEILDAENPNASG